MSGFVGFISKSYHGVCSAYHGAEAAKEGLGKGMSQAGAGSTAMATAGALFYGSGQTAFVCHAAGHGLTCGNFYAVIGPVALAGILFFGGAYAVKVGLDNITREGKRNSDSAYIALRHLEVVTGRAGMEEQARSAAALASNVSTAATNVSSAYQSIVSWWWQPPAEVAGVKKE